MRILQNVNDEFSAEHPDIYVGIDVFLQALIRAVLQEMEALGHIESMENDSSRVKIAPGSVKFLAESSNKMENFRDELLMTQVASDKKSSRIRDDWRFWLSVAVIIIVILSLVFS